MRFVIVLAFVVALVAVASAFPYTGDLVHYPSDADAHDLVEESQTDDFAKHYRQKRATCDLLSAFGVGHAACAVHCIGHGYRGGWCDGKAVCNCRR